MKKKDDSEPIYFARSEKNTHMTLAERLKKSKQVLKYNDELSDEIEEIMLKTRATGLCVESYFQKFGSKTHFGLTYQQFRLALYGLELKWAEDDDLVKDLWDKFDQDTDEETGSTISYEEIAMCILDHVKLNVVDHENEWLEIAFAEIKK